MEDEDQINKLAPGILIFITDCKMEIAARGTRIELGIEMHKLLAEDPDAIANIAVEMIVAAFNEVAFDNAEASQLQWRVTELMNMMLQEFKRRGGEPHCAKYVERIGNDRITLRGARRHQ